MEDLIFQYKLKHNANFEKIVIIILLTLNLNYNLISSPTKMFMNSAHFIVTIDIYVPNIITN